jgi:hypothetical protein
MTIMSQATLTAQTQKENRRFLSKVNVKKL